MLRFYGPYVTRLPDPRPEPAVEEYYIEARLEKDTAERSQVTVHVYNRAVHPPHYETDLSYRYFIDLSEVFSQGYGLSNVTLEQVVNQNNEGVLTPTLQLWDELKHIYYVQVSYPNVLLYNRREFQFGLIFVTPNYAGKWDSSNDPSRKGMTATLAKNPNMALYRSGKLIWGAEPYKDVQAPAAPSGLVATAIGSSQINLDWSDNRESDLEHYNIYRGTASGFTCNSSSLVGTAVTSAFAATDLIKETRYYFKVTAVDSSRNESIPSAEVSAVTLTPDSYPPAAPTGLRVAATRSTEIDLDWNDNLESDLSKYRIYRGTTAGFAVGSSTLAGSSLTSNFTDKGLTPRTTYYYKVVAVDTSANDSPASAAISATTLPPSPPKLRVQYKCTNTGASVAELRFNTYLYNDGDAELTLSDITLRYWFTSEPPAGNLIGTCDYADVGHDKPTYKFGTVGNSQYVEIGFSSTALVPTWLGGNGTANRLPPGARTGEIQNRVGRTNSQVTFTQTGDWSFNAGMSAAADWDRITVLYQGDVLCWGIPPESPGLAGDVNASGKVDIIDALQTARYCAGLNPSGFKAAVADVNRDGSITIVDAMVIAQYVAGLIPSLPK
jgi:chitodextrinase